MNVKILLFPLSLVIALALGVFWIKPAIVAVLDKRASIDVANQNLGQVRTIVSNIAALSNNLDTNADKENLVITYFPKERDDERVIDVSNFLSSQVGAAILSVKVESVKSELSQAMRANAEAASEINEIREASPTSVISATLSTPLVRVTSSPETRMQAEELTLSMVGTYDQLKAFLNAVRQSNRLSDFRAVEIKMIPQGQGDKQTAGLSSDVLQGIFTIRFSFLPPASVQEGTYFPIFEKTAFDFQTADTLQSMITNPVSPLEVVPSPRPNPFLR